MTDLPRERLQSTLGAAYTLERELHGGGMSRVFVARDSTLERDVVIKVLASELAQGLSAERFAREIRLAATLQEPHIVPLLSAGTTSEGLPYYTMPYVRGESLRQRMSQGPIPLTTAVGILRDVAHALAYAHAEGVVHRDIKPENVLLSSGTAVVTDFGIAKAVSASRTATSDGMTGTLTRTGSSIGTPAYMAPEQGAGDAVDQRADLYSWGVLAYELLAGRHPFTGRTTAQQLIAAHVSEAPPPLSVVAPDVPKHLASLVMACLAKSPGARPNDAGALLAVLEPSGERPALSRLPRGVPYIVGAAFAVLAVGGGVALGVPAWRQHGAVSSNAVPAITVLPFENLSGDSASTYFSDGMTEEMLGVLERARVFRVSSRATTFSYKGRHEDPVSVAAKTGGDAVLTGSVRRVGDRLKVVAELARGSSGERIWGETYERSASDVLIIQEEIARAIASSLRITLAPRSEARRVAPAAHDAYLRAVQLVDPSPGAVVATRESMERAIALLEQAVADDSTFARGWAQLGRSYMVLAEYVGPKMLPKAKESILRAVQLDPTNAEVARLRAGILIHLDWNWEASEREYRRALALDPQSVATHRDYSALLGALRRHDEALRETARANALESRQAADSAGLRAKHLMFMAHNLAMAERTAEARRAFEDALRLAPTDAEINERAGMWLTRLGDTLGAVQRLEIARRTFGERMPFLAFIGGAYGMAGQRDSARRILARIERRSRTEYISKDQIAVVYLCLGDRVRGLRAIEQAIDEHHWWIPFVNNDPWTQALRADPEFRRLMKRLNVPDASL